MLNKQIVSIICFIVLMVYSLLLTSFQFGKNDGYDAYSSFHAITQHVGHDDLLLMRKFDGDYYAVTTPFSVSFPLNYFFQLNPFFIARDDDLRQLLSRYYGYFSHYKTVYLLSSKLESDDLLSSLLTPIDHIHFQFSLLINSSQLPPRDFQAYTHEFYLYRVQMAQINTEN